MKKVVLFALLLATVAAAAASAQSHNEPRWSSTYRCDYQNYSGNASDPGYSTWHNPVYYNPGGTPLIRAQETFTTSYGTDTYNCSWAKPSTPGWGFSTTWEFTFNPSGPQCKKTVVSPGAYKIVFNECTDGHTRTCTLLY
jgi:opacity protein-like surface antigen